MIFVPSASSPFHDHRPNFSLTNISHPCPITISPPLSNLVHFTDFLARWPQSFTPGPIITPLPYTSSLGPFTSSQLPPRSPTDPSFQSLSFAAPPISISSIPQENTTPPLNPVRHNPIHPSSPIHPTFTPVSLNPVSLPLSSPLSTDPLSPFSSSSRQATRHSPRLSRFHPYTNPTSLPMSSSLPLATDTLQVHSPSPTLLPPKRKWTDANIPLAVLKKTKPQHLFPGLLSNMELAAASLASLKDGASSVGQGLTIHPLPITGVSSGSATGSPVLSPQPLRRFSRAARGLDVFSSLQATHSGTFTSSRPATDTDDKGVDHEGPPQQ